jgi:hypothetical protein
MQKNCADCCDAPIKTAIKTLSKPTEAVILYAKIHNRILPSKDSHLGNKYDTYRSQVQPWQQLTTATTKQSGTLLRLQKCRKEVFKSIENMHMP